MTTAQLTAVVSTKGAAKSKADLDKFTKSAANSDKAVTKLGKQTQSVSKNMQASVAAVTGPLGGVSSRLGALTTVLTSGTAAASAFGVGLAGVGFALADGVIELDKLNIELAKTEALLQATGFAAGVTAEELQREAQAIALNTLASVEGIQQAQQVLVTFNKITGEARRQATALSQDLATVFGGTAASQATQLGKALQDPVKGITALNRVGVSFSETQKQQIKLFTETGEAAKAQTIILSALTDQVGGAAGAAASGTLAGALDTTGQLWSEFVAALADSTGTYEATIGLVDRLNRGIQNTKELLTEPAAPVDLERVIELNFEILEQQQKLETATTSQARGIRARIKTLQSERDEIQGLVELEAQRSAATVEAAEKGRQLQKEIIQQEADDRRKAQEQENIDRLAKWRESIEQGNAVWSSEYTGYGSKAYTDSVREQQFELANVISESNNALAEEQIELAKRIGESFSSDLAGGIVDSIVAAENLGDALLGVVGSTAEAVAKALLEQVIQTQIVDRVIGGLYAKNKAAEVAATVQQAGLNAFASTAGAPFPINLSAPAAATAATAIAGSLGAGVVAAASAREQGGQLSAGQLSTGAERDQFEVIAPASASRVRTAQQMRSIMGEGGGTNVNLTVIDQSEGAKEYTESTNDQGDTILLIRNIVSSDLQSQNSDIAKARRNTRSQAGF